MLYCQVCDAIDGRCRWMYRFGRDLERVVKLKVISVSEDFGDPGFADIMFRIHVF